MGSSSSLIKTKLKWDMRVLSAYAEKSETTMFQDIE